MHYYRLYFLARRNLLTGVEEGSFENDEAALAHARALLADHFAVELWTGRRWVDQVVKKAA